MPIPVGRVQRQVRRSFIAAGGKPVRMIELVCRAYPEIADRRQYVCWRRWSVYRALRRWGVHAGYGWWRPNAELMARIRGDNVG